MIQVRTRDSWVKCKIIDHDESLDVALLEVDDADYTPDAGSILIPRDLWRGSRPADDRFVVELCTEDANTPRSLEVELRPGRHDASRVEFVVPMPREGVRPGYSGGPLLEAEAGSASPRMLGLVRARDLTTVDAFDQAGTGWIVPTERIAERFAPVAALVESPVEREAAWIQHWEPRSRGVATHGDDGYFFTGRANASARVDQHLDSCDGLLIVTGTRGRGKSAVLADAVVRSCARYNTLLATEAPAARSHFMSNPPVDAAILARGKSVEGVADELAQQLGLAKAVPENLVASIAQNRRGCRIVIDAIDESSEPDQLMIDLIIPLVEARSRMVIAGLAPRLDPYAPSNAVWVDLDTDHYGDDAITPYVTRRLRLEGTYAEPHAAIVAAAVAARATGNFLIAELIARTLARSAPIDTTTSGWQQNLPRDLTAAFRKYLDKFGADRVRVLALLHPLAHARGDGLTLDPPDAWLSTANSMKPDVVLTFTVDDLRRACERAADYLIIGIEDGARCLYHEGLASAIRTLAARERLRSTNRAVVEAEVEAEEHIAATRFVATLRRLLPTNVDAPARQYSTLDPYLLRHLPDHLADERQAHELLDRPGLLLVADQQAIRGALVRGALAMPPSSDAMRVAVVHAFAAPLNDEMERAACLGVALRRQREQRLAESIAEARSDRQTALPFELVTGHPLPPVLFTIRRAHAQHVWALAVTEHEAQPLLVSAGEDGALRSWRLDGTPGPLDQPNAHSGAVRCLAVTEHEGEPLILSGGDDGALQSWRTDGSIGPFHQPDAHLGIWTLTVAEHDGDPLVVSGGMEGSLVSWRLDGTAGPLAVRHAHERGFVALAVAHHDDQMVAIAGTADGALHSWRFDGMPGSLNQPNAHSNLVIGLIPVEGDGMPMLVSGGFEGEVKMWDLNANKGALIARNITPSLTAIVLVDYETQPLLIAAGIEGRFQSWRLDGSVGRLNQPNAHACGISTLATVEHEAQSLLVSGDINGALRFWRIEGTPWTQNDSSGSINTIAIVRNASESLLISGGDDGAVRSWHIDGSPGPINVQSAHSQWIWSLLVAEHRGQPLIISSGGEGAVRSWYLDGRAGPLQVPHAHSTGIVTLALAEHQGRMLILSGAKDGSLRSWHLDGTTGQLQLDAAHTQMINALVISEYGGRPLLISAGDDGGLRSWHLDGHPGPFERGIDESGRVQALALVREHEGQPLLIAGDYKGALRSWYLDGTAGPLLVHDAHMTRVTRLKLTEHEARPLLISCSDIGELRSWWLDGTIGPLEQDNAHTSAIMTLAIEENHGRVSLFSAGLDGAILAHRPLTASNCGGASCTHQQ